MSASDIRSVPLLDLKRQYALIREEARKAIDAVCESQHFVMGKNIAELEKRIAAYSGCSHAIGVSSGTDALLIALMALDVGVDDAVITTPYTFFRDRGHDIKARCTPNFLRHRARYLQPRSRLR